MSIIYCEKHDRHWDQDHLNECPRCEAVAAEADEQNITCPRCSETMPDRDCAEGCEDHDCPFIGGEK